MTERETHFPKQVQIFISEVCTEGCNYCPYSSVSSEERKKLLQKELTIGQWKKAISYLYEDMGIRLFALIGGEPAAKKDVHQLVSFMTKQLPEAEVLFVTSGIPLLKNENLKRKLVEAGMRNVIVSVDGISEEPNLEINLAEELEKLKTETASRRKSLLGLYFLLKLRRDYPEIPFKFGAGCIVNKQTLDLILPTYHYLAAHRIYLNLCPEQTVCFGKTSPTVLTEENKPELEKLSVQLVEIKRRPGNFLMVSEDFLQQLPTVGLAQSYKCAEKPFPTTIHLNSDGEIPFCNWRRGDIKGRFNILEMAEARRDFQEWLDAWRDDKNGQACACSWTFPDRVGDFSSNFPPKNPNIWFGSV